VASTAALTSGLVVPSASADQMSSLQAQASALAARITSLGNQEEALAEQYDAAQYKLTTLQTQVSSAKAQLASAQASVSAARAALEADAIQAYVDGGSGPMSGSNSVQGAEAGVLRAEYVDTLATDQSDAIDQFHLATLQEQAAASALQRQETAASHQLASINSDRNQVQSAQVQLSAQQTQVSTEIQKLKAQEAAAAAAARAAQQAAARQAAEAQAAALAAAAAQLQNDAGGGGGGGATDVNYTPPPPGSGASGAVAAAESRVGDWYQWGAAGPNTFDCSGLVMWAYAQVGISLPHYSGAQYDDTTHIPMSDLQPGDLVFFSDPGEHVAMYIGNGEIIEAPHTGAQVHIVPMYSEFTLASRVEG
jgi:cell wall-associated NlpC family hydrolase